MASPEASEERSKPLKALDVTLQDILGKGSYGSVYSATHLQHGAVAVKVLPWGPDDVSTDMKRELKLLQRCKCDYIVRAYGMLLKPADVWIVMELCDLGSVLDVMRSLDEPLDEPAIAAACRDALRGLRYLHEQKHSIIHRDVKCANLLLSSAGCVKLADFGVAAQLNSTASKRSSVIGTPHWMAPEVIQNGRYGNRADCWSLGVTAIEMAQLRPPYHEMRPVLKVMFAIASGEPPQLDSPQRFSGALRAFVADALVKDPSERPSAAQLLEHPFLRQAERASLLSLVPRARLAKAQPRPKSRLKSLDSLQTEYLEETLRASGAAEAGGAEHSGTFCMRGGRQSHGQNTAGATSRLVVDSFGMLRSQRTDDDTGTGGTFCARPSTASRHSTATTEGGGLTLGGGTARPRHGTAGGTLLAGGTAPPPLLRSQSDDSVCMKRRRCSSGDVGTLGTLRSGSPQANQSLLRRRATSDDVADVLRTTTWHVQAREAGGRAHGRALHPAEDVQLFADASRCVVS